MTKDKFEYLEQIFRRLRKECPWDREQTNDSIKAATLEEAYEVVHAIDEKDYDELKKELGDLLLHVIFHSVVAEEMNKFTLEDVIQSITDKMIRRHPHVFGNTEVSNTKEVLQNWEKIKLQEGRESTLDGIPLELPALIRATRVQEKASKVGFDWSKKEEVWPKIIEELEEFKEAELTGTPQEAEGELGDLLFSIVNYTRFVNINAENALRRTTNKFEKRFKFVEAEVKKLNKEMSDLTLNELDVFWNQAKLVVG